MIKKIVLVLLLVVFAAGGYFLYRIGGPRNLIGMIRYDQREEGRLRPGDPAPDVELVSLDGASRTSLASLIGRKPLVLVFGSFT